MEQLITIETIPLKIEYVEKKPLVLSSVKGPDIKDNSENVQHQIKRVKSEPIRIDLQDSYVPSSAYNWDNSTYTATAKIGTDGKLKLDIRMEDGDSKAIRFAQANRGIDSIVDKLNYVDTSQEGNVQLSIPMVELPSGITTSGNMNAEFMPPDLEMVVTQRADVIIKYVGGPIYVPLSAAPGYKPPLGFEPASMSNQDGIKLDQKV